MPNNGCNILQVSDLPEVRDNKKRLHLSLNFKTPNMVYKLSA